jgi:hypothetical protein
MCRSYYGTVNASVLNAYVLQYDLVYIVAFIGVHCLYDSDHNEGSMKTHVAVVFLALIGIGISNYSSSNYMPYQDPISVVDRYCEKDLNGARLSSDSWRKSRISELTIWGNAEPGWDYAIIVGGYHVEYNMNSINIAKIHVTYEVLGVITSTDWYAAISSGQSNHISRAWSDTVFTLTRTNNQWQISAPQMPPHVAPEMMLEHLVVLQSTSNPNTIRAEKRAAHIDTLNALIDRRSRAVIPPI